MHRLVMQLKVAQQQIQQLETEEDLDQLRPQLNTKELIQAENQMVLKNVAAVWAPIDLI